MSTLQHDPDNPNVRIVEYTTKVIAVVDIETREIVDVRVIDEEITPPTGDVYLADQMELDEDPLTKARAIEIAENDFWPAWRVSGWS
jgi:hypothetical protein